MLSSYDALVVVLLIGLLGGSAAGNIIQVRGFDLASNLALGVVGAFVGSWLLPHLHIHIGSEVIALVINAAFGAIVLLLAFRFASVTEIWGQLTNRSGAGREFEGAMGTPSVKD